MTTDLASWNEGDAKSAIVAFVEQTVANAVPVEERIAVFDADGTLWCEKPLPVEADFLLRRLAEMAHAGPFQNAAQVPYSILLPSFVTSELKTAFQIGFLIFLPFIVIDLVVATVLMSLGMMMLSPTIISLPFKLLLFVLVDGWALTMGSLANSFMT